MEDVAQLVERLITFRFQAKNVPIMRFKQQVVGSNPTIFPKETKKVPIGPEKGQSSKLILLSVSFL